jgi:phage gp45-like|nr:MAG TPA: baseplate protein [Caudoviricetes sp.]
MSGFFPGVVASYDKAKRLVTVTIPGLADTPVPAELMYSLGDRATPIASGLATEIEIVPGDHVWLQFIGGDSRYPLVVGFRNPQAGNRVDWRAWHHKNIMLKADEEIIIDTPGTVRITGSEAVSIVTKVAHVTATESATIKSQSVTIDAPSTSCNGALSVSGALTVNGGAAISGGSGAVVSGTMNVVGAIAVQGTIKASGSIRENSP